MKTNLKLSKSIAKGIILIAIAISIKINISAQKSGNLTNSSEEFALSANATGITENNMQSSHTPALKAGNTDNLTIEEFLIKAAGLNQQVSPIEEATMNDSEQSNNLLEQFMMNAAGLNQKVNEFSENSASESQPADNTMEQFLIRAAGLNDFSSQINEEVPANEIQDQTISLGEFLINASGLKMHDYVNAE